jgi:hypothetical protein
MSYTLKQSISVTAFAVSEGYLTMSLSHSSSSDYLTPISDSLSLIKFYSSISLLFFMLLSHQLVIKFSNSFLILFYSFIFLTNCFMLCHSDHVLVLYHTFVSIDFILITYLLPLFHHHYHTTFSVWVLGMFYVYILCSFLSFCISLLLFFSFLVSKTSLYYII